MVKRFFISCIFFLLSSIIAEAHPGIGIVVNSEGTVYYTDLEHVWRILPSGERSIAVRNIHTHELYLDDQDNLYGEHEWYEGEATDKWGNYVWCLTKAGEFKKIIPDVEGFLENNTLVRDPEGNSYWAENPNGQQVINRQTPDGKIPPVTTHKFRNIRWMYFSEADNYLYVVDELKIKKVSPTGEVTVIAANLKEASPPFESVADRHYVYGIWTNNKDDVYVAVYGACKIKRIDADGTVTTVYQSKKGWSPCGGLFSKNGTQWIMEFSENNKTRVIRIDRNGDETIYGE